MNNVSRELLSYAESFVSFLLHNLSETDIVCINSVILFGSVARGDASRNSDVDLFIDARDKQKAIENKINHIKNDFYKSHLYNKHWVLLGIENDIKPIIGNLREWKDLRSSIIANGIMLFGKYKENAKGKNYVVIYWDKIGTESKRTFVAKKLNGYNYKGKKYDGLLKKIGGEKTGTNCIIIPSESYGIVSDIFKKHKISIKSIFVSKLE
ncbi:MAG: nucleotidyltransferase domain-containing protein [Candidatus Aenigmatarchaeota archaeon]